MKTIGKITLVIAITIWFLGSKNSQAQILENCWGCTEEQQQTKYLKYLAEQASVQDFRHSMRELNRQTERYYKEQERRWDHDQRQRAIRDFLDDSDIDSYEQ